MEKYPMTYPKLVKENTCKNKVKIVMMAVSASKNLTK